MRLWIFDLDGTLVDTSGDIVGAVNRFLEERGRPPMEHDSVMHHVGFGTPHLMARVLGLALDDDRVPEATSRFVEIYASHPADRSRPYPGARETLEALSSDSRLVIVSNKSGELVRATLEALDMTRHFDHAWGGREFGRLKPAPDGILKAMRETSIPPERTTMVGDMPMDVIAGRRAGVRTLFAGYGFGTLGPDVPPPDGTIRSLTEVLGWP